MKGERTSTILGREVQEKKKALMPTGETVLALMMCHKAPNREKYPRFLLCEFQADPQQLPLPHPSWPHRWTFEKQSLESVPSNGFIKEVIILQRGGAVNGRSNDVFHYPTLTKLFFQGLTEYLQLSFFQGGKELFLPFLLPPPLSTEDLSALIKTEFSQHSSAVNLSPLRLNRLKRGLRRVSANVQLVRRRRRRSDGGNRKCLCMDLEAVFIVKLNCVTQQTHLNNMYLRSAVIY